MYVRSLHLAHNSFLSSRFDVIFAPFNMGELLPIVTILCRVLNIQLNSIAIIEYISNNWIINYENIIYNGLNYIYFCLNLNKIAFLKINLIPCSEETVLVLFISFKFNNNQIKSSLVAFWSRGIIARFESRNKFIDYNFWKLINSQRKNADNYLYNHMHSHTYAGWERGAINGLLQLMRLQFARKLFGT